MSQSAEGAVLSENARPAGRGMYRKMARVWELVSEIIRVLAGRESDLPARDVAAVSARSRGDSPPKWIPRSERKRSVFARSEPADETMPAVWQNVQSRALVKGLTGASSLSGVNRSSMGSGAEIDWSPFLMARINDDFARPPVMPD